MYVIVSNILFFFSFVLEYIQEDGKLTSFGRKFPLTFIHKNFFYQKSLYCD
jgi:hypothetical protein